MKKKILKIIFVCFAFVFLFSLTVLPTLAYTSVNGWNDYAPNMPDMQLFYLRQSSTPRGYPRTLTGYVSYEGSLISSQSDNGNIMRTLKTDSSLGYSFTTFYAAELFLDFVYLPFASSAETLENIYSLDLSLDFTTSTADFSSNPVTVRVRYLNTSGSVITKSFTYQFENNSTRNLNLYSILEDSNAHALISLQIGYDYSGEPYANQKYLSGRLLISNLSSWITYDPFVNASKNLFDYSYEKGFNDAIEQLAGATGEQFYNQGYQNGYNAGRDLGYQEGYNQASSDSSNANYQSGYQAGYTAGFQAYANSVDSKLTDKYNEGYEAGKTAGYKQGELVGVDEGYTIGWDEGYDWGYDTGYDEGITKNIEEIGLFNYIVSSCNAIFQIPLGKTFTLGGLLAIAISIPLLLGLIKLLGA